MGLLDDHLQVDNTKLGNDVLFYDQHVSQLLGDLYGDDFRVPYQLKDIGIDIREEKGQKVPDLYKYEGEEIVICPEPITFYREYDDVSDRTELVQKRFIEALEDANRFKKIVLNQGPTVEVCGDTLRVWRGKTISGINLRPGACENGDTLNKPVKLSDDNVHGLIIGRTGAGKSVYINNLILSLISEYAPWELDLYLADFKKVELSRYMNDDVQNENTSFTPHVNACAATSEIRYVLSMFRYLSECMKARNELFTRLGVTKIQEFRDKYGVVLPRVLLVIDEFQQLFTEATSRETEEIQTILNSITKLGRATGFHLVFASQEMSGTLRGNTLANFKIRMALPCNRDISVEYLGNGAAVDLQRGYVLVNTEAGSEMNNIKFRVPYIATEVSDEDSDEQKKGPFYTYLDQIKKCGRMYATQLKYKSAIQKFYQEDLQEPEGEYKDANELKRGYLNDLWKIRDKKNMYIARADQYYDAIVLGKTVEYSNKKNDKVTFYIEYGRNKGIMIASPKADDVARIRKLLTANLILSDHMTVHIGVELNGLIYNRFPAEKYINLKWADKKQSKQRYYGMSAEDAFGYLQNIYGMRRAALSYLNDVHNRKDIMKVQDNLRCWNNYVSNEQMILSYRIYLKELNELETSIKTINSEIQNRMEKNTKLGVHPLISYLEYVNSELVTSDEQPKEEHLVYISKLDVYQELFTKFNGILEDVSVIEEVLERLKAELISRKEMINTLSGEERSCAIVVFVRMRCLYEALLHFKALYANTEVPATQHDYIYDAAYENVGAAIKRYKDACNEVLLQNEYIQKLQTQLDELSRKRKILLATENPIEQIEKEFDNNFQKYIQFIVDQSKCEYVRPEVKFSYHEDTPKWKLKLSGLDDGMLSEILKREWSMLQNCYMKKMKFGKISVKDFDKCIFWLNGMDELNKIPSKMEEIIRNSINTNILFVAMITSELRDSSIRKAFDYAFVTGNVEKFYDMFNIKYTKQAANAITVNFGIQSQGLNMPFKMYRTELDVVQMPNFVDDLLEELM